MLKVTISVEIPGQAETLVERSVLVREDLLVMPASPKKDAAQSVTMNRIASTFMEAYMVATRPPEVESPEG